MNVMAKAAEIGSAGRDMCSRPATGTLVRADSTTGSVTWQLPDEVPVALQINSEPYAVMMATPSDLRDFAVGFLTGDANGSGAITAADVSAVRARSGQITDDSNYRHDMNATGRISAADISASRARASLGLTLH